MKKAVAKERSYMIWQDCTEKCARMPECALCGRRKAPIGRDVAAAMGGSYCNDPCSGYRQEPHPGHLWPEERRKNE